MHVNTIGEQELWFFNFFNPYYFEQVSKQRLKVKKSIKRLLNAIFWLDF